MSGKRPKRMVKALPSLRRMLARLAPWLRGHRALLGGPVAALPAVAEASGTLAFRPAKLLGLWLGSHDNTLGGVASKGAMG